MDLKGISYLKIFTLVFIVVATFFLPLKTSISNIGLIGVIITTFTSFFLNGVNMHKSFSSYVLFSPMVFFIPLLFGVFYTNYLDEALLEIGKYVFLGIMPLLLYRRDIDISFYKKFAIIGLLAGCLVSSLILLAINTYHLIDTGVSIRNFFDKQFTGNNFLAIFKNLHPIYLGSYYAMALAILLFGKFKLSKTLRTVFFLIITLAIVFLASRIIYLVSFFMICLYLIHNLSFKLFAVLLTGVLIVFSITLPKIQKTDLYKKAVIGTQWEFQNKKSLNQVTTNEIKDTRFTRWQIGWNIVKENPLLGVGGGAENEVLLKNYQKYSLEESVKYKYNVHNQFLGFAIRFGIVGFLLLCVYFTKNIVSAIRYQHLLFLAFLTILFCTFLVENILDRNMGINFVALFGTLFYGEFLYLNQKIKNDKTT